MFHWYKIIRYRSHANRLVHDHDGGLPPQPIPRDKRRRWFWLGLIETIPMAAGLVASAFTEVYFPYDFLASGIVVSIVLAWLLREKLPAAPIHAGCV